MERDFLEAAGGEAAIRPVTGLTHHRVNEQPARWFRYSSPEPVVDLTSIFGGFRPTAGVVAYAFTTVFSPRRARAFLAVGSNDGVRIWLNGEPVHTVSLLRGHTTDDDVVPVTLRRGTNRLLVKVANESGKWKFSLRIAGRQHVDPSTDDGIDFLRFGKKHYSQGTEEVVIRHFFDDRREGFFLDVGSGHFSKFSNTYYLEKELGWSGIAVDALPDYAAGYEQNRPSTKFFSFLVSDHDAAGSTFFRAGRKALSSTSREWVEQFDVEAEELAVPTVTLTKLLEMAAVGRIDLLSMDIELHEPQALAGFDIDRFRPALVCIEAHPEVRKRIADYFVSHGYERIDDYLAFDQRNWYFRPVLGGSKEALARPR